MMKTLRTAAVVATAALAVPQARAAFPADVTAAMDATVDPCDDFYQYACGGWLDNVLLPSDQASISLEDDIVETRNKPIIQDILKQDWPLIGELYESCMAFDLLSAMGKQPLQRDLARIQAATTVKQLTKIVGSLSAVGPSLFMGIGALPDAHDATTNILHVGSADSILPDDAYYTDPDNFAAVEAPFRQYISTLVQLAGINLNSTGQQSQTDETTDAENVIIDIEKQLADFRAAADDSDDGYFAITYSEAAAKYPLMFHAMAKGLHLLEESAMTVDSKVILLSPSMMERAEELASTLDVEDLKIYYSFLYVHSFAAYLGDEFVQARFDLFQNALRGIEERPSRERVCSSSVIALFPDLVGKYYFLKAFDSDREQNVRVMVSAIEQAMSEHIARLSWLDEPTRKQAAAKLAKVANLIGHSTAKKNYSFTLTRDNYFANVQAIQRHTTEEMLARIDQRVDRSEWAISAATINAYYDPRENKMVFPAAILQPPFYNGGSHPVQNFGAIGAIIGHELTHGFDDQGSFYDGDGNERDWWTDAATDAFEERAVCMANQYSEMAAFGDSGEPVGNVNGNLTIGENIADNGGVSLAFDAYHNWVKSGTKFNANGIEDSEVDKLFFVAYGQSWCNKIHDDALRQRLASDPHAPGSARVNGVAMNSEQFAKTFQCKAGSRMNPEKKCNLW